MNNWQWLTRKFPGYSRGARARSALADAYRRVLMAGATATDEDKQIVLADLANASGFYRVSGPGFTAEDRAFNDGMRAVYGHAHKFLSMTEAELRDLQEAARQEAIADSQRD